MFKNENRRFIAIICSALLIIYINNTLFLRQLLHDLNFKGVYGEIVFAGETNAYGLRSDIGYRYVNNELENIFGQFRSVSEIQLDSVNSKYAYALFEKDILYFNLEEIQNNKFDLLQSIETYSVYKLSSSHSIGSGMLYQGNIMMRVVPDSSKISFYDDDDFIIYDTELKQKTIISEFSTEENKYKLSSYYDWLDKNTLLYSLYSTDINEDGCVKSQIMTYNIITNENTLYIDNASVPVLSHNREYFSYRIAKNTIGICNVKNKDEVKILSNKHVPYASKPSPDGKYILGWDDLENSVIIMNVENGVYKILSEEFSLYSMDWA